MDIHALNKFGCAAVQWAAAAGNVSTCRWLMSKGVSFEHVNHVRHGALNKAAVKGHVEAVRWLLYAEDGPKLISQLLLLDLQGREVAAQKNCAELRPNCAGIARACSSFACCASRAAIRFCVLAIWFSTVLIW